MSFAPLKIAILGDGIAGQMCALALHRHFGPQVQINLLHLPHLRQQDIQYGLHLRPDAYPLLETLGIAEPDFLLGTQSVFALAQNFRHWGPDSRNWVQAYHKPLPVLGGVEFHHLLDLFARETDTEFSLDAALLSVAAAKQGKFAHPPKDDQSILSTLDYGFFVTPQSFHVFLDGLLRTAGINPKSVSAVDVKKENDGCFSVFGNGEPIAADLIIDTRPYAPATAKGTPGWTPLPNFKISFDMSNANGPGSPMGEVNQNPDGWSMYCQIRGKTCKLSVSSAAEDESGVVRAGYCAEAWTENHLRIGPASVQIDPLTGLGYSLLFADILRLLKLVPLSKDMAVETHQYNRQYQQALRSVVNYEAFLRQHIPANGHAFWRQWAEIERDLRLENKHTQFLKRAMVVAYDNECVDAQDWLLTFVGLGYRPEHGDRFAAAMNSAERHAHISGIYESVRQMAERLPPHDVYLRRLIEFLARKKAQG